MVQKVANKPNSSPTPPRTTATPPASAGSSSGRGRNKKRKADGANPDPRNRAPNREERNRPKGFSDGPTNPKGEKRRQPTAEEAQNYWAWQDTTNKWEINPKTGKMETREEREHRLELEHLNRIFAAFNYYAKWQFNRIKTKVDHSNMLPPAMKALLPKLDEKFHKMRHCVLENQKFLNRVTKNPLYPDQYMYSGSKATPSQHNMDKVRSTLKQCVRDWAEEGERERKAAYGTILDELVRLYPDEEARHTKKVLNPGCGLGRLTWEIARLGFGSTGNEFSYFMLMCSYVIINTLKQNEITIYPYIDQQTNQWTFENQSRGIKIPHVDPYAVTRTAKAKSLDYNINAGDFTEIFKTRGEFDVIASCFFLDTAKNVMEYLKVISHILKPGGHLVNMGPLLYHFDDSQDPSIELTYEELKSVIPHFGLKMIHEQKGIRCPYTSNTKSMLQMHYDCVLFTLEKVDEPINPGLRFAKQTPPQPPLRPIGTEMEHRKEADDNNVGTEATPPLSEIPKSPPLPSQGTDDSPSEDPSAKAKVKK